MFILISNPHVFITSYFVKDFILAFRAYHVRTSPKNSFLICNYCYFYLLSAFQDWKFFKCFLFFNMNVVGTLIIK